MPAPLSRRIDAHLDHTRLLVYICTVELNDISARFWSWSKNLGETWELETAKELLWLAVRHPPKDATAGCGWFCASLFRYLGTFLGMFNMLVEMWPQFPFQKHQCVLVPQAEPQAFGSWAPF